MSIMCRIETRRGFIAKLRILILRQTKNENRRFFQMDPPVPPNPEDCCNSGCNPCILDVYEEQLKLYREKLEARERSVYDGKKSCILPTEFSIFKVADIVKHAGDTFLYTFEFVEFTNGKKTEDRVVKYEAGQHFVIKAKNFDNEEFSRAYTPLMLTDLTPLQFCVLIKLYKEGEMSRYIKKLKIGSQTLWRGPYGSYSLSYMYKNLLFIAQGTGLAPFFSIIQEILKNEDCCTFLKLFYCCRNCSEILLREKLQEFSSFWNFTYEVFISDNTNFNCKYNEKVHPKKLNLAYLQDYIEKNTSDGLQVLICGSQTFSQTIKDNLVSLQCDANKIVIF